MDVLGRDYFIDSLDDSDLRWRVYQVKAKSLDDAVCAAVEMEAYKKAERQRIQPRKSVRQVNHYKYENSPSPAANETKSLKDTTANGAAKGDDRKTETETKLQPAREWEKGAKRH